MSQIKSVPEDWILRSITRGSLVRPVSSEDMNDRIREVADFLRGEFTGTKYGISGIEDYSNGLREGNKLGNISIYVAEHNADGRLDLTDSASVQLFVDRRVVAESHSPHDEGLADICRKTNERYSAAQQVLFTS